MQRRQHRNSSTCRRSRHSCKTLLQRMCVCLRLWLCVARTDRCCTVPQKQRQRNAVIALASISSHRERGTNVVCTGRLRKRCCVLARSHIPPTTRQWPIPGALGRGKGLPRSKLGGGGRHTEICRYVLGKPVGVGGWCGPALQPWAFFARIPLIVAWAERNRQRLESIGIRNVCAPLKDEGDEIVKALVFQLERNLGDSSKDPRTM